MWFVWQGKPSTISLQMPFGRIPANYDPTAQHSLESQDDLTRQKQTSYDCALRTSRKRPEVSKLESFQMEELS
jgi:hypothetical protein